MNDIYYIELNEDSLDQLVRFIEGLRARGLLNKEDCHLLKELLFEDRLVCSFVCCYIYIIWTMGYC